jgi:hypothetical protein
MISCAEWGLKGNTCAQGYAKVAGSLAGLAIDCGEPNKFTDQYDDRIMTAVASVARNDKDKDKAFVSYIAASLSVRGGPQRSEYECATIRDELESVIGVLGGH